MSSKKGSPISTFALLRRTKISIFLNKQLPLKNFDIFTVSESLLYRTVCDADILIPGYTTSGRIEGHTREAAEYSSMLKTRPASLKNGPQYLKSTINC